MNKVKSNDTENGSRSALIFIPDISGYTRFLSNTEISHSKHIIEELLEIIIDANDIGLKVSEIEGDAILFYRFGKAPTSAELLAQIQKMFVRFHAHLKKYDTHRICQCGACKTANCLTLKFVAHYGEIDTNKVKERTSLFGKEVIVAHRLMKNNIDSNEYAMFTHNLINACSTWVELPVVAWDEIKHGADHYDSGKVNYCHIALRPLMEHVPEPTVGDYSIKSLNRQVMFVEAVVEAPMDLVFDVVADLPWRSAWIVGATPKVTDLNTKINQVGATHKCLANGPVIYTGDFKGSNNKITFTEIDTKATYCVVYTLIKLGKGLTRVEANAFMKNNIFMLWIFKLLMKKKLLKIYSASFSNLNSYCKNLYQQGKKHPNEMILVLDQSSVKVA